MAKLYGRTLRAPRILRKLNRLKGLNKLNKVSGCSIVDFLGVSIVHSGLVKAEPEPRAAAEQLKKLSKLRPTLGMVLGSGFHHVLQNLEVDAEISYEKL